MNDKKVSRLSTRELVIGGITYLLRLVVGITFVVSGYFKAIDPWGTIYKLREYAAAMHMHVPESVVIAGAFMLFSLEFLLGACLITGSYRRWTPRIACLIMAFMLPLTLWIALSNPVADCGCFGDALLLSNWATFWKNVALMAFSLWLLKYNDNIRCFIIPMLQVVGVCVSLGFILLIGVVGYNVQPLVDFRPYPVGAHLIADDEPAEIEQARAVWKSGEREVLLPLDSIPESTDWEFVRRESDIDGGAISSGLAIYEDGEDVSEDVVLTEGKQVIVFFPSIREVSIANYYKLNSLYNYAQTHDIDMVAIGAGAAVDVSAFRDFSLAEYPIYTAEDTAIKEVVRGNPGIVYLVDGKIIWKSSFASVPTDDFMDGSTHDLRQYNPHSNLLSNAWIAYLCSMLAIIMLSHVPMIIRKLGRAPRRLKTTAHNATAKSMVVLAAIAGLCSCSHEEPTDPSTRPASSKHTVLVYMIASNDLQSNGTIDMEEIKQAVEAISPENINVLVYEVKKTGAPQLKYIRNNGKLPATEQIIATYPEDNASLTEERLRSVIQTVREFAPAESYGLFLWSHSLNWLPATQTTNAPKRSFGDDNGMSMDVTDLVRAIPDGMFRYIWMDCCLMGSIELAYQMRNKCDYYIAYPTKVLGAGAPYEQVLPLLATPTQSAICDAARLTYESYANNSNSSLRHCVISVVATSALDAVADVCAKAEQQGSVPSLIGLQSYGYEYGVSFYDLRQVFQLTDPSLSREIEQVIAKAVVYKAATPRMLNVTIKTALFSGLSATMPSTLKDINQINLYHELDWYQAVYAR